MSHGQDRGGTQPPGAADLAHDAGALSSRTAALRIELYLDDAEEVLKEGPAALLRVTPPPGPTLKDRMARPFTGGHESEKGHLFLTQWRLVFVRNELAPHCPPVFAPLPELTEVSVEQTGLGRVLKLVLRNGRQYRFACRTPARWASTIAGLTDLR